MSPVLTIDDLAFEVRHSASRKTLGITVGRMSELVLSAPPGVPDEQLREFAMRKRLWVYKQLARKEALQHVVRRKVFTDGEGFTYLGRTHRLRLVDGPEGPIKLTGGRFVLLFALLAQRAHQPLGQHTQQSGIDKVRRHPQLHHAGDGRRGVVGVQG